MGYIKKDEMCIIATPNDKCLLLLFTTRHKLVGYICFYISEFCKFV